MAELKDRRKEYYIPDNFIEEGRIFQGRIKIRNLIEAVVLAAVFAVPGLLIIAYSPGMEIQHKITLMVFLCAPPAAFGVIGFNGDRLFTAIKSAVQWRNSRYTMLYNTTPRLLKVDVVAVHFSEDRKVDQMLDKYENSRQRRIEEKANLSMVEGRDFVFAEDEILGRYTGKTEPDRHPRKGNKPMKKGMKTEDKPATEERLQEISGENVLEEGMNLF